jgi:hypothetical protein
LPAGFLLSYPFIVLFDALLLLARLQEVGKDEPLRVLLLENLPRYEYRALRRVLLADPKVTLRSFLASADPEWEQPASKGTAPLTRPSLLATLTDGPSLGQVDVLIWGDLHLDHLTRDAGQQEEIAKSLRRFVRSGKGLLFIAGKGYAIAGNPGAPLSGLLPIELIPEAVPKEDPELSQSAESLGEDSIEKRQEAQSKLIKAGKRALRYLRPLARSDDPEVRARARAVVDLIAEEPEKSDPERFRLTREGEFRGGGSLQNKDLWSRAPKLRWWFTDMKLRSGAQTLMETEGGKPVLVLRPLEKGRTGFLATDDLWLWRGVQDGKDYETLYQGILGWLAGR